MSIRKLEVKGIIKELEERAEALSFNSIGAWWSSMQLPVHVESLELCSIFSNCPSLALAAWAFALEAGVFFGHLLTLCPVPLQNMQRLLVNRRAHSSEVSLPSFLSLLERSGFLFYPDELDKLGLGLLLEEEEADLLSEGWFLDENDVELVDLFDFCSLDLLLDFLDSWEISDWCSQ